MEDRREEAAGTSRRQFLQLGVLAAAGLALPGAASAHRFHFAHNYLHQAERALKLFNAHTGEYFKAVYWAEGRYLHEAMHHLNFFMRDFHNNHVKPMDTRLVDLLFHLNQLLGNRQPIAITSGYRSPQTNRWLAQMGYHASPHSLHMEGKAADIIVPGRSTSQVFRTALNMQAGGVGYYPNAHFVHVDVGRVRRWTYE